MSRGFGDLIWQADTYADISKARRLPGYAPQTKIETGIPKFVESFQEQ